MTSRQQRRAEERKARKQEIRQGNSVSPAPQVNQSRTVPEYGALTPSLNPDYSDVIAAASLAMLLPNEEAAAYRVHLLHFLKQHAPEPGVESEIVKRLADLQWRLKRIANLEAGIMALGRLKNSDLFTDTAPDVRIALLDAQTLISEGLTLRRLHTQEGRLRRFYVSDLAELTTLKENRQKADDAITSAAEVQQLSPAAPESLTSIRMVDTDENGFEFSTSYEIDLSDEPEPADCLNFMFGSDFSTDILCKGLTPKQSDL